MTTTVPASVALWLICEANHLAPDPVTCEYLNYQIRNGNGLVIITDDEDSNLSDLV